MSMMGIHKQHPQDHLPEWIETSIIILILLVVGHTVLEELAVIYHWSHIWHIRLAYAAFAFDLIFSAEFAARTIVTARRGHFKRYITAERGWLDMLTSFPLLLLVSGPTLYLLTVGADTGGAGMQFLVILKTAKAIRVTRILRLLRVIKIFGRIQNTNSTMTNRHVATISTLAAMSLVSVLMVGLFVPFLHIGDHEVYAKRRQRELAPLFHVKGLTTPQIKSYIQEAFDDIISIKNADGVVVYEDDDKEELHWTQYPHPIELANGYTMLVSFHPADGEQAKLNLLILLMILGIIASYMFFYTGIFARDVGDPVFIMEKGLKDWDYNLEVKINRDHSTEEIYQLAHLFNTKWLPLKHQIHSYRRSKQQEKSAISVSDIL
ncbi:MAG: ion transporter [Spirochaetia bacterium]|nr:ion transporter [Spirochaetia bacterium]